MCVSGGKGVGGEQSLGGATMKSIKQKFPRARSSHSVRLRSDKFPPSIFIFEQSFLFSLVWRRRSKTQKDGALPAMPCLLQQG